jgi:hypothetical protein
MIAYDRTHEGSKAHYQRKIFWTNGMNGAYARRERLAAKRADLLRCTACAQWGG